MRSRIAHSPRQSDWTSRLVLTIALVSLLVGMTFVPIADAASGSGSSSPTPTAGGTGSLSIVPGGTGSGQITSQPAGINCTITRGNGSGTCSAFFPAGTVVRLDARPAADSQFQGWRGLPGCFDPSKITIFDKTNINCQPGFQLKF
jgi:hypothetical protein